MAPTPIGASAALRSASAASARVRQDGKTSTWGSASGPLRRSHEAELTASQAEVGATWTEPSSSVTASSGSAGLQATCAVCNGEPSVESGTERRPSHSRDQQDLAGGKVTG